MDYINFGYMNTFTVGKLEIDQNPMLNAIGGTMANIDPKTTLKIRGNPKLPVALVTELKGRGSQGSDVQKVGGCFLSIFFG